MTTSEPTTGEIVRALRYCVGKDTICGTACPAYLSEAGCRTTIMKNAADRLESQERDLETLRAFHERYAEQTSKQYVVAVCGLTARAEQAERERDAAVANINLCMDGDICKACVSWKNGICSRKDNRCDPKYRGLQQKNGEEK